MFKTALTSHVEMWLYLAAASVGLVHHSFNALVRLFLSRKVAPGRIGGDGADGGGGWQVASKAQEPSSVCPEFPHTEGAWSSKLSWMSNWLQPDKPMGLNISCAAPQHTRT